MKATRICNKQNKSKCIIYNTYTLKCPKLYIIVVGHQTHSDCISIFGFVLFVSIGYVWFGFDFVLYYTGLHIIRILAWDQDTKLSFNKVVYFLFRWTNCCPQWLFTIHNQCFENNQVLRIVYDWFCLLIVNPLIKRILLKVPVLKYMHLHICKRKKMRLHTGLYLVISETFLFLILVLNEHVCNVCTFIFDT